MIDCRSNGRIDLGGAGGGAAGLVSTETPWIAMPKGGAGAVSSDERTIRGEAGGAAASTRSSTLS